MDDQKEETFTVRFSKMVDGKIVPSYLEVCQDGPVWLKIETSDGKIVELRTSVRKSTVRLD